MNDKFFDLKQDRQDKIINAALKIFSQDSYHHASTDDIVREAHISKGLLFHYFESKLGLYSFLYDYSARFMLLELSREVNSKETNYISLVRQMEQARMQVMHLYPYMQPFLRQAADETDPEAGAQIARRRSEYENQMKDYLLQADYSPYVRYGDPERIRLLTDYMIAGITRSMSSRSDFTPELLNEEINTYLDILERSWSGE